MNLKLTLQQNFACMESAYIVDVVRTPIGRYAGKLSTVRPDDLLAHTIKALLHRNHSIDVHTIEDVIAGAANQAGEDNRNVARMAALLAGLPETVAGNTVNRLCASGLQAIMDCARAIMCGEGELDIAGGVESMTRAPMVMAKSESAWSRNPQVFDSTIGWRFINKKLATMHHPYSMGETAENLARQRGIERIEQDEFALASQNKYLAAQKAGKWKDEIVPVEITENREPSIVDTDEHPRQTSLEKLLALKAAFVKDGTVTAGNSSGINDGAGAMLLASEKAVQQYHLKPMARIISMAVAGVEPAIMGIGPVPATKKALQRAGLTIADLDLVELNEAFSVVGIVNTKKMELDPAKVNVNGGAVSLGHPLGCSGARIIVTLLNVLNQNNGKIGAAGICNGGGGASAMVVERIA